MIIYYDASNQFDLTDEEFKNALPAFEQGKNVWVERLKVHLTPFYKWAGERPPSQSKRTLSDGTKAERKFDIWYLEGTDTKINVRYYPELLKDEDIKQLNP